MERAATDGRLAKVAVRSLLGVCVHEKEQGLGQWRTDVVGGRSVETVSVEEVMAFFEKEKLASSNGAGMFANLKHFLQVSPC